MKQISNTTNGIPSPKNTRSSDRSARIIHLSEQIEEVKNQIILKERRRVKAETVRDYSVCDSLSTEKRKLLSEKGIFENELRLLERKEQKSLWYHSKKTEKKNHKL